LRRALGILSAAYLANNGKSIDEQPLGFGGGSTIYLNTTELQLVSPLLNNIANAVSSLKGGILQLEQLLMHQKPSGEDQIDFDLSQFNDALNDILFRSTTLGEATAKMNVVQARAEEFLRSVKRNVQGN
jgi:hypothetical protein